MGGEVQRCCAQRPIYHLTGISAPVGISTGPDGALWFTNTGFTKRGYSIGRIATAVTPKIISASAESGAVETTVTITGRDLSGASEVAFHGTPATIVSNTATKIVVTMPAGATTGHVSVTMLAGTATSHGKFSVT